MWAQPSTIQLRQHEESKKALGIPPNQRNGGTFKNDPSPSTVVKVEIYPGVSETLRGAQETANAAKRNFVVNCTCPVCTVDCSCIADAAFVICPTCQVVYPLEGPLAQTSRHHSDTKIGWIIDINIDGRWGVGLGFIPDRKNGR
jgi:hypothetical protein